MHRETSLFGPTILLLGSSLLVTLAYFQNHWAGWLRSFLVIAAIILATVAIMLAGDWLIARYSNHLYSIRLAMSITPVTRLVMELRGQAPGVVEAILSHMPDPLELSVIPGPVFFLELGETRIPWVLLDDFIARVEGENLPPVRTWNDGAMRDYAKAIIKYLVDIGWARPAKGNQPARLVKGRTAEQLRRLLGYD